ncbi:Yqey-like protein [compost metagenome]
MYQVEEEEIAVINQFLPKQLDREVVAAIIETVIKQSGATSVKDMGKVMGMANKELAGKADGKLIAEIVKEQLA